MFIETEGGLDINEDLGQKEKLPYWKQLDSMDKKIVIGEKDQDQEVLENKVRFVSRKIFDQKIETNYGLRKIIPDNDPATGRIYEDLIVSSLSNKNEPPVLKSDEGNKVVKFGIMCCNILDKWTDLKKVNRIGEYKNLNDLISDLRELVKLEFSGRIAQDTSGLKENENNAEINKIFGKLKQNNL